MIGLNGGLIGKRRDPFAGLGLSSLREKELITGTDPLLSRVELLLPMTGDNNGASFTDLSSKGYVVTRFGAVTSTARWPFTGSGSSGLFNGTSSDYLTVGSAADWRFLHDSSTDYTIEALIYVTSNAEETILANSATSNESGLFMAVDAGNVTLYIYRGQLGSSFSSAATGAGVTTNAWHHVAAVVRFIKAGATTHSTITLYLNGSSVATASTSTFAFSTSNSVYTLNVGRYPFSTPGGFFSGNISNLRITKQARYTGNFTAPTMPFPAR